MEYSKKQFIADVTAEAEALRVHATKEERENLCLDILDPTHQEKCVYGLMTGNCDSKRATDLITACTVRYIADSAFTRTKYEGFERIQEKINGETVDDLPNKRHSCGSFKVVHYSMIEGYILIPGANNKNLIGYLREETDELNLDF